MTNVDNRAVHMEFDNQQFEKGIDTSLKSLDDLKKGLNLDSSAKSLSNLSNISRTFSLASIADGVDNISTKFSALGVIGFTILQNLTNAAINMGTQILNSLTLEPLKKGYAEYETQINAIQTILANTASKGTNINQVNDALDELNHYADMTIYNFTEMARNIGTFTAAGVGLDQSVSSIKGIANLAALSGSTSQQASVAMYQLSQALASGTVRLMDWNSVVNAGMGGEVFKNALMETARVHGIAIDDIIKKEGSFRESLQTGWLSTEILTETLGKFTGDMNAEQLKTLGYSDEQIKSVLELGQRAKDAATKVKTLTQLFQTLEEATVSGWAQSMRIVVGDFEEARVLFTNLSDILGGMINASAESRNNLLTGWKDLGGRKILVQGVNDVLMGLVSVLKTASEAFAEIFPPVTAKQLFDITKRIGDLAAKFKFSEGTLKSFKTIFTGIASLLDIGRMAISAVVKELLRLVGLVPISGKGVLQFATNIATYVTNLRNAIKTGDLFTKGIDNFKSYLKLAASEFKKFTNRFLLLRDSFIKGFQSYSKVDLSGLKTFLSKFKISFEPLSTLGKFVGRVIGGIGTALGKLAPVSTSLAQIAGQIFGKLATAISDGITNFDFNRFFEFVNTGLLASLVLAINNFLSKGSGAFSGVKDLLKGVSGVLDGVRGSLEAWQNNLNAKTLMTLAGALGILTASVFVLSQIDPAKLTRALFAMGAMFAQLATTIGILQKLPKGGALSQLTVGLIGLSLSVLILSAAVKNLSTLNAKQLMKGIGAVEVLIVSLAAFSKSMSGNSGDMIKIGVGLIFLSIAIRLMSSSIEKLGSMKLDTLLQGLKALGLILIKLTVFMKLTKDGKSMISTGLGLTILASAMLILTEVVERLGNLSWEQIGKGLLTMAAALAIITVAVNFIPKTLILTSIGLLAVALSLVILAGALKLMGSMSWDEIGRGLVVLAGSLLILAIALKFMSTSLPGAAALLVASTALLVLAGALTIIGKMKMKEIGKALLAISAALLILGIAGYALTPVIPTLLSLAGAMFLFGLACVAVGAGVVLLSIGLAAFGVSATGAAAGLVLIITSILGLLPLIVVKVGEMIIAFVEVLKIGIPKILEAFTLILLSLITAIVTVTPPLIIAITNLIINLLNAIIILAPKFVEAAIVVLTALLNGLASFMPTLIDKGFEILLAILKGIRDNIKEVVTVAIEIVTEFIDGVAQKIPDVIASAFNLLLQFINGLSDAIDTYMPEILEAVGKLVSAIVNGLINGIKGGADAVGEALANLGKLALEALKKALGIASPSKETDAIAGFAGLGLIRGFVRMGSSVKQAAGDLGKKALDGLGSVLSRISETLDSDLDLSPTIRPVLDLSSIQSGNKQIGDILGSKSLDVGGSANKAASISLGMRKTDDRQELRDTSKSEDPLTVSFVQNNYSPKALSNGELYRQTKNQLSRMKGLLGATT